MRKAETTLPDIYEQATACLDNRMRLEYSFDMIGRRLTVGGRQATLYFVDGFIKDEIMEKIMEFTMKLTPEDLTEWGNTQAFADRFIPYVEVDLTDQVDSIATAVLSGTLALLVEGYPQAILIDARTYPVRGITEPDDDRVLRGSRDGFVETLVFNTALIRRRIRDPRLTMEILQVGKVSKTDVVVCYLDGRADPEIVERVKKELKRIDINSLSMGQESLSECLLRRQWFNPFPKIRYTERPDAAAAGVAEGRVLVIIDNTPAVMILPTSLFDFVQDTNDYYFPPLVGTYLRAVRSAVSFLTLFLTPVWYLLMQNPDWIPAWLDFIRIKEPNSVPVIVQLLIVEFMIDGIKLASLNTPSVLSNAFGVVGALLLGEFAVSTGLFVPEVLLYMAFVSVSNFTQPSFELGYAFKLFRLLFLILTALFQFWGFAAGILLMLIVMVTTRTVTGRTYLYPLIPFNKAAFLRLLLRRPINNENS